MLLRVLTLVIVLSVTVRGQRQDELHREGPTANKPVKWQAAFGSPSPDDTLLPDATEGRLILMLITGADPSWMFADDQEQSPKPWCEAVLAKSLRGLFKLRPDLIDRAAFQHLAAGTPSNLSGGKNNGLPQRAMLVVLDDDHRLLGWMVGVPDSKGLIALVEDAEEVHLMNKRFQDVPDRLGAELVQRSMGRLDRRWAAALDEQWLVMGGRPEPDADTDQNREWMRSRLSLLATVFRRVYLQDVALRFGLTEKADRSRLAILEQHPEARRPWCESMIPFVACVDFRSSWHSMVESVWNLPGVSIVDDASELIAWWDQLPDDQSVVLALRPPLLESTKEWPPPTAEGVAAKRGLGWDSLQELLVSESYREVTAHELSYLMRDRGIAAIDVRLPSRVRYLFFESTKKKPILIRESDIPGRHVAYVKRFQN